MKNVLLYYFNGQFVPKNLNTMLFWTVVTFISYSLIYFVISQRKIRRLQNSNLELNMSLRENKRVMQNSMSLKGQYKNQLAN